MPASGSAKAVSDYELLSSKRHLFQKGAGITDLDNSADSDFLPLKPLKSLNKNSNKRLDPPKISTSENVYSQNSIHSNVSKDKIGLTQMLEDFGHLDTLNKVPIPTAWSPGIGHVSNPALRVTPDKPTAPLQGLHSKHLSDKGKENLLEPQSGNTVPIPFAWGSDMIIKPNPALVVTPDKPLAKMKHVSQSLHTDDREGFFTRTKHSVRFDLPSASSGEETLETSGEDFTAASSQSPITLKGGDIDEDGTPAWKAFTPPKAYNPSAYSDESALDDLEESSSPDHHFNFPPTNEKQGSLAEETTADRLADKLQELLTTGKSSSSSVIPSHPSYDLNQVPSLSQDTSVQHKSSTRPHGGASKKVMSAANLPSNVSPECKASRKKKASTNIPLHKTTGKAGPEFLRAPPSPYEPKPARLSGPQVIRESEASSPTRNNYAFPYEAASEGDRLGSCPYESTFARPEYNSTLRVRSELDELCEQEVDVEQAVASTLIKSEDKRTELSEKASVYTNRMSNQFFNLVDLEPSVDSLCSQVVRMRTSKAQKKKKQTPAVSKSSKSSHSPPDLMEFFPHDLQKESPDFSLPGVKTLTSQLQPAPRSVAFDLYKHNRVWHGINDY